MTPAGRDRLREAIATAETARNSQAARRAGNDQARLMAQKLPSWTEAGGGWREGRVSAPPLEARQHFCRLRALLLPDALAPPPQN
jgi:hypothetical protein